jgi:hypothetical protein
MAVAPTDIIGRDEARVLGLKRFFPGKPCKRGHVTECYVSSRECVECNDGRKREWRAANLQKAKERERKRLRKYRAAHPEMIREYGRRWKSANSEKVREYRRRWRAKHKDKINKRRAAQRRTVRASEFNGAASMTQGDS